MMALGAALERHRPEERALEPSTWGEGKDLRTWDSPPVADLAWAARRLELRLVRHLRRAGSEGAETERAARELLALQSSDWAFLDGRRQAGDYPCGARHEPRRGHAGGHTLRGTARSAPAQPGARPEPRSAVRAVTKPP